MSRFDVVLVALDPVRGSEIAKTRPAVVVSPDAMNRALPTVIVAPLTSTRRRWPTRVPVTFEQREGDVALDQVRTVDGSRIIRKLGNLEKADGLKALQVLRTMFS